MRLSGLLSLAKAMPPYEALVAALHTDQGEARTAVLEEAKAYLVACLFKELRRPILWIVPHPQRAKDLLAQLQAWLGEEDSVQLFPEPGVLPYERLSPDRVTVQNRLTTLAALSGIKETSPSPLVVASVPAIMAKTVSPAPFASACHTIRVGMPLDWRGTLTRWLAMGYETAATVEEPGTMARRGGILDIFSPQGNLPARIELFGDIVESIRLFDPDSQRSVALVDETTVVPAREVLGPPWVGGNAPGPHGLHLSGCTPEAQAKFQSDLELLFSGQSVADAWFYAPFFNTGSILDYLGADAGTSPLLVLDEFEEGEKIAQELETQAQELRQKLVAQGELPENFPLPYFPWREVSQGWEGLPRLFLNRWASEKDEKATAFRPSPHYGGQLRAALREIRLMLQNHQRVVVLSHQAQRLAELLREEDLFALPTEEIREPPPKGSLTIVQGSSGAGWRMGDEAVAENLTLITDVELFGFQKEARRTFWRRAPRRENPLAALEPGDYVVHEDQGIARFGGTTYMVREGLEREYLVLEYAEGDRLYLPTEHVDRIARYIGPGGYAPVLSRLGGWEWPRAKERVKKAAQSVAQDLLTTAAAREALPGFAFTPDTPWQQELEASFPYLETPDQMEAIRAVKGDMERPHPMDRLVCGDVGYGKTEVAMRAAFKAVQDGAQVAILVPTTVLAQQHYATFSQRLSPFPVKVEVLSRFRSEKEQREVIDGLKNGAVDICIGTHRLLQKDVAFKNLRLVVVDEEQRFGVLHKEHFKQLRWEADVLTLSATPIPRTLHMALVGVRDMSTMETPPEERLPIKTYVMEYNEEIIREAILREMERGGQVFFVHNRVYNIEQVAFRVRNLVPEAEIGVAHGQMPEEALERVMLKFVQGEYDVLVCTTIIESGLDLPNVNTIIVNQGDKLGLAQLYQLRGRVGRGTNRAYAYLLYDRRKALTETAQKRLQAIFEASELGAGFQIAMRDLEIRGTGNLMGTEQSGHIGAVGFHLYCRLVAEAVEKLKEEKEAGPEATLPLGRAKPPAPPSPTIDLPMDAYLPPDYVDNLNIRLDIYRRLAEATSPEEVEEMAQEIHDRFGRAPAPVQNLLYAVTVKTLAYRAGVHTIATEEGHLVVRLLEGLKVNQIAIPLLDGIRVGNTQVRVDLALTRSRWQAALLEVLEKLATSP